MYSLYTRLFVVICIVLSRRAQSSFRINSFSTIPSLIILAPRVVEFIAEIHNITVLEGEDATFKCVVSPEDAKMVWCMNGWPIPSNEKYKISSNGLCHMLYIRNCQVSDSCKLTAEAEGVISKAILQVQGESLCIAN